MSDEYQTISCPICGLKYLERSLTLHIVNKAKCEAKNAMYQLLDLANNKPYSFSPAVMLRQMPHVAYVRRNTKNKKIFHV
jgi:hypothetical protein